MLQEKEHSKENIDQEEYEKGRENLSNFFNLLLKIDMRVNPDLYEKEESDD